MFKTDFPMIRLQGDKYCINETRIVVADGGASVEERPILRVYVNLVEQDMNITRSDIDLKFVDKKYESYRISLFLTRIKTNTGDCAGRSFI